MSKVKSSTESESSYSELESDYFNNENYLKNDDIQKDSETEHQSDDFKKRKNSTTPESSYYHNKNGNNYEEYSSEEERLSTSASERSRLINEENSSQYSNEDDKHLTENSDDGSDHLMRNSEDDYENAENYNNKDTNDVSDEDQQSFNDSDDAENHYRYLNTSDEDINSERKKSKQEGDDDSSDEELKHVSENDEHSDNKELIEDGEIEDDEDDVPPEMRIEVEIPRLVTDLGREIHFVKLPNFLSVDPRPFDPETYEDEIDEEETLDEEGRARLKLKVENTLRWRNVIDKEGNVVRQSNARLVKWSDGSLSLLLGSEAFDVCKQPLQGDHNHLFLRQGTGLQGQAVFRTKLSFRPHSTESFTHRKMTLSLADRSLKTQKVKVLTQVGTDPEAHRDEMIKREEDRLRASLRRETRQRRVRDRISGRSNLTANYLEPDRDGEESDDEGAISLAAIKNRYKKGGQARDLRPSIYSSDDDASDIEIRKARRLEKAKALRESDDEYENIGASE